MIDSISHHSCIDGLGVSGSWYGTWGGTWPSGWIGRRLRQIGRGVWGGLMGSRHVEDFGIDAGGNDGVGVDDTEGILPVHRELKVVHGITCHGIYESEGCEFVYTVTSQALSYPTCRLGLVVLDMRGFLDRGFSSCAVPAFCHGPGISSCMQVYVLPKDGIMHHNGEHSTNSKVHTTYCLRLSTATGA